jgi:predicted unusual protein kinase regulating ubiquinone biosynthesis (AarF/ABC1/UbiB family)
MEYTVKTCSVCKQTKNLEDFYRQTDGKFGVTSRCKPCILKSNSKYTSKEKSKVYMENWRNKNNNREKALEASRQWRKKNLHYDAFRAATYRATKKQRTPSWANLEQIKMFYLACPIGYHVDHIIPLRGLQASGLHVESNLQYLPAKENLSKRNLYGW